MRTGSTHETPESDKATEVFQIVWIGARVAEIGEPFYRSWHRGLLLKLSRGQPIFAGIVLDDELVHKDFLALNPARSATNLLRPSSLRPAAQAPAWEAGEVNAVDSCKFIVVTQFRLESGAGCSKHLTYSCPERISIPVDMDRYDVQAMLSVQRQSAARP